MDDRVVLVGRQRLLAPRLAAQHEKGEARRERGEVARAHQLDQPHQHAVVELRDGAHQLRRRHPGAHQPHDQPLDAPVRGAQRLDVGRLLDLVHQRQRRARLQPQHVGRGDQADQRTCIVDDADTVDALAAHAVQRLVHRRALADAEQRRAHHLGRGQRARVAAGSDDLVAQVAVGDDAGRGDAIEDDDAGDTLLAHRRGDGVDAVARRAAHDAAAADLGHRQEEQPRVARARVVASRGGGIDILVRHRASSVVARPPMIGATPPGAARAVGPTVARRPAAAAPPPRSPAAPAAARAASSRRSGIRPARG